MFMKRLLGLICSLIYLNPQVSGLGRFDSIGGTYDEQTGFTFFKKLYYAMRARTLIGKLSKAGAPSVAPLEAGGPGVSLDGSGIVHREKISSGDMMRFTLQEHARGMAGYGDKPFQRGDFLAYKNMEARVNEIDSPAFPVQGRNAQRRVRQSITNIPAAVKQAALDWMGEQIDIEFLISLLWGGSPSVLQSTANGGLGLKLGVNDTGTAATPLYGRHWYTPQGGYLTYDTTPATWNTTVNNAVNAITAGAAGRITLIKLKVIRSMLDDIHFGTCYLGGKKYRAVCLVDSEIWYRLDELLKSAYTAARERSAANPLFNVDYQFEYDGILYLNVPNLKKFRLAYNGTTGYPDIGPGMSEDPRDYTTSSDIACMIYLAANAVAEGYDDSITLLSDEGPMKKGLEIGAYVDEGFIRTEWFAKDGNTGTTAVRNYNSFFAAFYEDGVSNGYT